jgi:hypothetical protein
MTVPESFRLGVVVPGEPLRDREGSPTAVRVMGPERELPEGLPRISRYGWCRLASMTLLCQLLAVGLA